MYLLKSSRGAVVAKRKAKRKKVCLATFWILRAMLF